MATKSGAGGLVYSVVAIAIIVLIVSTVAVPVIEDSQSVIRTSDNNATSLYSATSASNSSILVVYDADTASVTVNDFIVPIPTGYTTIVALSDDFVIYKFLSHTYLDVYLSGHTDRYRTNSIIIENSTISFTTTSSVEMSQSLSDSQIIYAAENGSYGCYSGGDVPYNVNRGDVIYSILNSTSSISSQDSQTISVGGLFKFTVDSSNIVANSIITTYESEASAVDTVTMSKVLDYDSKRDVYTVNNTQMSVSATKDGTIYSRNLVVPIFAPIEYTYISDSDFSILSLLDVLPILLFLVPVMFAVRMIQTRRN